LPELSGSLREIGAFVPLGADPDRHDTPVGNMVRDSIILKDIIDLIMSKEKGI